MFTLYTLRDKNKGYYVQVFLFVFIRYKFLNTFRTVFVYHAKCEQNCNLEELKIRKPILISLAAIAT